MRDNSDIPHGAFTYYLIKIGKAEWFTNAYPWLKKIYELFSRMIIAGGTQNVGKTDCVIYEQSLII